jgi:hypothetical protein
MFESFFRRALVLVALVCAGCIFDSRRAGTSTTTENTITGMARLSNGLPAAGATVSLRTGLVKLSDNRVPASQVLATGVAGEDGAFELEIPELRGFFLEVRASVVDSSIDFVSGMNDPRQAGPFRTEIFFREFDRALAGDSAMGSVALAPAASAFGSLEVESAWAGQAVWIGVPGTDAFTRIDIPATGGSSVPFALYGIPVGKHPLVLVVPGEVGTASNLQFVKADTLGTASAGPGARVDMGTLVLPPD